MTKGNNCGTDILALQMATKILIYFIIDYESTMYTTTNNTKIKTIQIVQNKTLSVSTNAVPNTKIYKRIGHLNVIERRNK